MFSDSYSMKLCKRNMRIHRVRIGTLRTCRFVVFLNLQRIAKSCDVALCKYTYIYIYIYIYHEIILITVIDEVNFDVLLTVHRSIFISVFNQFDAQILFHNKFYFIPVHVSSTCAHNQEVKIALHSLWYHHTYSDSGRCL